MPIDILAAIAADAMCMDALLTQHNRIAIVTQIKLKAQAIILEPIRYKLRKIAPACRIRHGNAVAQALLPCHRNAEFRGRVKRIKVNLLICRQQNVLVIAGNLRLAAERKVAAIDQNARSPAARDFPFLAIQQLQSVIAAHLDRRSFFILSRNSLPVQAKYNIPIDLPCAANINRSIDIVVAGRFDIRQRRHLRKLHIAVHMRLVSYVITAILIFVYPAIGLFQAGIPICFAVHAPSIPATTVVQQPSHLATVAFTRALPYHSTASVLVPINVNFSVKTVVRIPIIAICNTTIFIFRNRIILRVKFTIRHIPA